MAKLTDKQKLAAAGVAILRALKRIQNDKTIQYHMGVGTSTFDGLTSAYAALTGEDLIYVRDQIIPGSGTLNHGTIAELLE